MTEALRAGAVWQLWCVLAIKTYLSQSSVVPPLSSSVSISQVTWRGRRKKPLSNGILKEKIQIFWEYCLFLTKKKSMVFTYLKLWFWGCHYMRVMQSYFYFRRQFGTFWTKTSAAHESQKFSQHATLLSVWQDNRSSLLVYEHYLSGTINYNHLFYHHWNAIHAQINVHWLPSLHLLTGHLWMRGRERCRLDFGLMLNWKVT